MGIVSALGWSIDEVWNAMLTERESLRPVTIFTSPRCGHMPVGEVRGDPAEKSGLASGSRTDHLAAYAAGCAFEDAGLASLSLSERAEVGVVVGTCTGGVIDGERFLQGLIRAGSLDVELLRHHRCASPGNSVAGLFGASGFRATVSDACASGAAAVATACDAILSGEGDTVITGGVDSLTRLTLNGFCSLLNVSPDGCRPFDADRNGMSLGEGAGFMILESESHARSRGARIRAFVAGCGSTCDAFHTTAPKPDGSGALGAMRRALDSAGLSPADIGYVNAHGTGTIENDAAEAAAIRALFPCAVPHVSSTKRFFGHTLAAAGAIEAIVCVLAMERGMVPANLGLRRTDPKTGFVPAAHAVKADLKVVISNSLGFGGANSSLVLTRGESAAHDGH
jgi:3-oxoacyl-[acyl-carrier-protein] synthase II